jgi:glutamate N-acetyltransferase/amino-acid N-acetyltransferase
MACPPGFTAGGVACGIKSSGNDDLALIRCPSGANAAAVFTRNQCCAAPIVISREHLEASGGQCSGLLINSGCANAATGIDGNARARRVVNALAELLRCSPSGILVNSTGLIGSTLPDDRIRAALPTLVESSTMDGLSLAARAIMTTDTHIKAAWRTIRSEGRTCRVVGIAKGSGMIHPDMATMIATLMTDAQLSPILLDRLLRTAVDQSFHRITVDGDTSTNDAVFALASGASGAFPDELITEAMNQVTRDLAEMIVRDGEGATQLIRIRVNGASTPHDARVIARTIASSPLVRTGLSSHERNWGRIIAAIGRSGVPIKLDQLELVINDQLVFSGGQPMLERAPATAQDTKSTEVIIDVDLHAGRSCEQLLTCNLTEQYVRINADYAT